MRLDQQLRDRCVAAGLDPDEMERLFDETNSIGPVHARIGLAEVEQSTREREQAARAQDEASRHVGVGSRTWRTGIGPSFAMSIRLDHDEVAELRRRAAERGLGVSVLARSYIRKGLAGRPW